MRKSNQELAADFKELLTYGAKDAMDSDMLEATKAYRNGLWKAFVEIETRLDPVKLIEREKGIW